MALDRNAKEMIMAASGALTLADIIPTEEFAKNRTDWKRKIGAIKRDRRVAVGPYVTFYFESRDTMWLQVQEMLYIEKGGLPQAKDELEAYNPLIPDGAELTATFMIEIDDPIRRKNVLDSLGGIEEAAFLRVDGETINGVPEADQDRTTAEGKASSVQFVHFPFTSERIEAFRSGRGEVVLGFTHPKYGHMAVMPETVRAALAKDFA
jgi:Protein of unknown function (DUF3501)